MFNHQPSRCIGLIVLALGLFPVAGCVKPAAAPANGAPGTAAIPTVGVVQPQWKSLRRAVEQPGTIQAYEETRLFARVPGYLRPLRPEIDIGYRIRGPKYDAAGHETEPGEILAELRVPELEEEAKLKRATIRQSEAEEVQAVKALAAAEANIAVALAAIIEAQAMYDRWESESKRMTALAKERVVDLQNSEETLNKFQSASGRLALVKATLQKAHADRDRAEADVKAAKSRVQVATADALRSEALLGYAQIRAPYDGVLTRRKMNTGDFVQPAGGPGDWLFTVARLDPVRAVIAVPEADAELVTEKCQVKLTVQALNGLNLNGTVTRTSWALDPGARTLRTEIDLPNKDGRLRPGMYVYGTIVAESPECWTLPVSAVAKQGDALICFRIENDKALRTPLQVGRGDGQLIPVLKRQQAGTPVVWEEFTGKEMIASRAAGLTDGQAVQEEPAGK